MVSNTPLLLLPTSEFRCAAAHALAGRAVNINKTLHLQILEHEDPWPTHAPESAKRIPLNS